MVQSLAVLQVQEYPESAGAAPDLQSFAAASPGHRHSHTVRGKNLDPPATASSSHLDGTGRELTITEWGTMWDALECTRRYEGAGLLSSASRTDAGPFAFHLFTYASVNGSEQVQSESYLRSRSKVTYHVLLRFVENGCETMYVAAVRFFVRATNTAALLDASTVADRFAAAQRFAVVKLYNIEREKAFWGTAYIAKGSRVHPPKPQYDFYIVPLDQMTLGKVVFVPSVDAIGNMHPAVKEFIFLPYSHHYSAIDPDAPVDYDSETS